ncbi:MAG: hypothetical protein ACAI35_18190 [Candidatus Methylacidiphilales bacterium]
MEPEPMRTGPRPSAADLLGRGLSERSGSSLMRWGMLLGGTAAILYVLSIAPASRYCKPQLNYAKAGRQFAISVTGGGPVSDRLPEGMYSPLLWACSENTYVYKSVDGWLNLWGHSLVQSELILDSVSKGKPGAVGNASVISSVSSSTNSPDSPAPGGPLPYPGSITIPQSSTNNSEPMQMQEHPKP